MRILGNVEWVLIGLALIGYGYVLFYAEPHGLVSESTQRRLQWAFYVFMGLNAVWFSFFQPR